MQEKIEFEIYPTDRRQLSKIKRSFNFQTDTQALVFSLGFVGENIGFVKHKIVISKQLQTKKSEWYSINKKKVLAQQKTTENNNKLSTNKQNAGENND